MTDTLAAPPPPPPLALLHLDAALLVVDKPPGLLVHRTALDAHEFDTVVERLRQQLPAQLGDAAPAMLAPAHRLDKGTSGLLVFACLPEAAQALAAAFEQGQVHKRYLALVRGWPAPEQRCEHPLARDPELPSTGQPQLPACTEFRRLARIEWPFQVDSRHASSRYALVEAVPQQGRRHQIRRHLKHLGHPIVGDATHGKGPHNRAVAAWLGHSRLWLHALDLTLPHPATGQPPALHAPPDAAWQALFAQGEWQWDEGSEAVRAMGAMGAMRGLQAGDNRQPGDLPNPSAP
ncbi:pseudouridine synthase [Ideonella azotifigens]|uniref:tRNA pseudouridine synthase C n=1 Tax=Ideonella azotifigens TaxID=513160 RepID=A0ABP3URL0_9BURK|nr:pseudouridine synthase [Ideonella azotifigens]MCD2343516.1 pseudouridine synthase [Ideonella azotifigens]